MNTVGWTINTLHILDYLKCPLCSLSPPSPVAHPPASGDLVLPLVHLLFCYHLNNVHHLLILKNGSKILITRPNVLDPRDDLLLDPLLLDPLSLDPLCLDSLLLDLLSLVLLSSDPDLLSYLISLNPLLFKNIVHVGCFKHFVFVNLCIFQHRNVIFDILDPPCF